MVTRSSQLKKYQVHLKETVRFLKKELGDPPDLAVVFGSGLGENFIKGLPARKVLDYKRIPHFGKVSVKGHLGRLHFIPRGKKNSVSLLVFQGRRHFYEGIDINELVFPYRALALWGVPRVLLTNSSGSLRKKIKPGDLVWIKDHINLMGANPLTGPNLEILGPRFPSLTGLYQSSLAKKVRQAAQKSRIPLAEGVYVAIGGPSYETEAEVRAFQKLGGDLIGMSTVPEAIAATHAGMEVAALAAVSNSCVNGNFNPSHEEVLAQARKMDSKLAKVLLKLVQMEL